MQNKTKQSNQKQRNAVQTLPAKPNAKALHLKKTENAKTARAKFACNPKLAELIEKANSVFYFDRDIVELSQVVNISDIKIQGNTVFLPLPAIELLRQAIEELKPKFNELRVTKETSTLEGIAFSKSQMRRFIKILNNTAQAAITHEYGYNSEEVKGLRNISDSLEQVCKMHKDIIITCDADSVVRLLTNAYLRKESIEIKRFLKSLVEFSLTLKEVIEDKIVSLSNNNSLTLLDEFHSDLSLLANHAVAKKWAEHKASDLTLLPESIKAGFIVLKAFRSLLSGDRKEFGISEDDAADFLVYWFKSYSEKLKISSEKDYSAELFDKMFLLSDNIENICKKITATEAILDKNGNVSFKLSQYADALQGVNISRLRTCEICEKFFWANRKDAFTCSKQHAKTRRMRLLRQHWKESGELYLKARRKKNNKGNQ